MLGDLHIHSNFSDGSDTVEEIIARAKEKNLQIISITDHDTTDSYDYIRSLDIKDLVIIPGVEISAYDFKRNRKVHILGYNYKDSEYINEICNPILDKTKEKSLRQLELIRESGLKIHDQDLKTSINSKNTLYRQQIMYAIVKKPYNSSRYQSIYRKLFKNGGVADLEDIEYVDAKDVVKAITMAGGLAVMAHPGELDSFDLIIELIACGLQGVEVYHPSHSPLDVEKAKKICDLYGLFRFGGSDYHGDYYNVDDLQIINYDKSLMGELLK